jgi:hypothetical protein
MMVVEKGKGCLGQVCNPRWQVAWWFLERDLSASGVKLGKAGGGGMREGDRGGGCQLQDVQCT